MGHEIRLSAFQPPSDQENKKVLFGIESVSFIHLILFQSGQLLQNVHSYLRLILSDKSQIRLFFLYKPKTL